MHLVEFFVVGGFWFWILIAASFLVMVVLTEWEKGFLTFLTLVLTLAALQAFGNADILGFIWRNPVVVVAGVVVYFMCGAVWSVIKWFFFCRNQRQKYDDLKAEFLRENKLEGPTVPAGCRKDWEQYLSRHVGYMVCEEMKTRPKYSNHKGTLLNWMSYWPFSLVWTILNDPIRKLFRQLLHSMRGVYESISQRAWRGVDQDFEGGDDGQPPPHSNSRVRRPDGPVPLPMVNEPQPQP